MDTLMMSLERCDVKDLYKLSLVERTGCCEQEGDDYVMSDVA